MLSLKSMDKLLAPVKLPDYLKMPSVAFDLSDKTVKFFSAKNLPGVGLVPENYEEKELPEKVIVGGDLQDVLALANVLKYFKQKYRTDSFVNINLPEEPAFVFDLQLGKKDIESGNIRQYIEFKLPELIPFDASQAIFDFDILHETSSHLWLSITVYPQDIVEEYISAFELAGYTVKAAELETLSIYRSVVPKREQGISKTAMVLDIGTNKVGVGIFLAGAPVFSTAISFPIKKFFEKLFLEADGRKAESDEEFYNWKFKEGILFSNEEQLKDLKEGVISEIAKIIDYFAGHKNKVYKDISVVYLSGGNAATKGLDAFFESELSVTCQIAEVWQNMFDIDKYIPKINKRRSLQYSTLAGLTLKDFE